MNTETKSETYEEWESRRRQEIQDEAIAKAESNKSKNRAMLSARFGRLGINRPLQRTQQELAVVAAAEERSVLGAVVAPATNIVLEAPKNDAVASLPEALSKSIDAGKAPKIERNSVVNGSFSTIPEQVDCRDYFDIAKPFFADAIPSSDIAIPQADDAIPAQENIEVWLKTADTVGGIATSEILNGLGLPSDRTNEMKVGQVMQNIGYTKARKAVRGLPRQTVWLKD